MPRIRISQGELAAANDDQSNQPSSSSPSNQPPSSSPAATDQGNDSQLGFQNLPCKRENTDESAPDQKRLCMSISNSAPSNAVIFRKSQKSTSSTINCCAICLESMTKGRALFTAECSHSFHFQCIASSGRHGNMTCPICRAQWRDVPWQQRPQPQQPPVLQNVQVERHRRMVRLPATRPQEPVVYEDDEPVDAVQEPDQVTGEDTDADTQKIQLSLFPEYEVVKRDAAMESFTVLMSVKATEDGSRRAPIDLVTVLDVSGSMSGSKLDLLKRAMMFLISNLGDQDRLSVVTFSGSANRLFPLRRMNADAQRSAKTFIETLRASGGTSIAAGLDSAARIINSRRSRNPVSAIMLLSDGHDGFNYDARTAPGMITSVHSFGFGNDHDSNTLHVISERSGGTFSYLQGENLVQEAFAQCIGGLLTVTVQDLRLTVTTGETETKIKAVHAGSYANTISESGSECTVNLGDLYAGEARDVLLDLSLPSTTAANMTLISVNYKYRNPVSASESESNRHELSVRVSEDSEEQETVRNAEVDNQQRRFRISEAIAEAKNLAERGDMNDAQAVLESAKANLLINDMDGVVGRPLEAELEEMQQRMRSASVYAQEGRAYLLSSISSHSRQRATSRGNRSEDSMYQTASMSRMVTRSHRSARQD